MSHFGVCNLSIIPLRAEASDRSEILTQLLFGECFEIIEIADNWTNIRTCYDEYEGWIDSKQYQPIRECLLGPLENEVHLGLQSSHKVIRISTKEKLRLVTGSVIPAPVNNRFKLGDEEYQLISNSILATRPDFATSVADYGKFFLQAPYLWGGKSVYGIDCSGFTQTVFRMLGKKLKRDAWQQAEQGDVVNFLQEARAGDLAFFDNEEGRIIHVGIMLDNQRIIHASGRVKVDPIDGQGIYSTDLKRHTHKLRIIKRF